VSNGDNNLMPIKNATSRVALAWVWHLLGSGDYSDQ